MNASASGGAQAGVGRTPAQPAAGLLLGGRYRLRELLGEQDGSAAWRATDEVLARTVAVRTLPPGSRRAGEVTAAARAAAKVGDPRLALVLDADDGADPPYIVTEWPSGARLSDLLATGPVGPWRAARMIARAAAALATAHEAGLAHLCLNPDALWCDDDEVKITGLGIAAALTGTTDADPALADTRGLAWLLYAALTGYWPGPGGTALPAAPRSGGRVRSPSQVRPWVPASISAVTCRALAAEGCGGPPIYGPAQLSMELEAIIRPGWPPLAVPVPRQPPGPAGAVTPPSPWPTWPSSPSPVTPPSARPTRPLPAIPPPALRLPWKLLAIIVLAGLLAAGGWLLARALTGPGRPRAAAPGTQHGATASRLVPVSVSAFGPRGSTDGDNPGLARFAIDASPATAWHTDWYTTADFGNLKPGTGLLLDMGRPVTLASVQVTLGSIPGADLELRAGDAPALASLAPVAQATDAGGVLRLHPAQPARCRYLLLWFTRLPPDPSGTFQVSVSDIRVNGSP
jgi:serine/threonine protein kinase